MIKLRGGLIEPATPALAAVDRNHSALIARQADALRIFGTNPDLLVIITARRALE